MRYTAEQFWRERYDVRPTMGILTANDAMREAFIAGAVEALVCHGDPDMGDATVYVAGLGWRARRKLQTALGEWMPLGRNLYVKRLKGRDDDC